MEGFLLDDSSLYETKFSPVCTFCSHLKVDSDNPRICKAFTDRIPDDIWEGKNDHTKSFKGDKGIVFEKR